MQSVQAERSPMPRALLLAAASGCAYALAQPSWGAWPLAFVCLVPLLRGLVARSAGERALLGWVAGSVATILSTVVPATVGSTAYFEVPIWMGIVIALTVGQVFGAATFALAAAMGGDPGRGPAVTAVVRFGCAFVVAEFVRGTLLTGLPWLFLAHALAPVPELLQSAAIGGEWMLSFWLALLNAAVVRALIANARERSRSLALAAVVAVSALALSASLDRGREGGEPTPGAVRPADPTSRPDRGWSRVLLVQPDLPNAWRGDVRRVGPALERLSTLSGSVAADIAVWPENAVSVTLPMNTELVAEAVRRPVDAPDYVLIGTPRVEGGESASLRNSAVLFGPDRRPVAHHDKVHLLPFAEYEPWPLSMVRADAASLLPGERPRVLDAGPARLGPLICFEVVFAGIARELVEDGAGILVNISNDAWFGTTGAIEQHFAAAVIRAVETRRPVLRATNTGITAAIDARGRVVGRLPAEERGVLVVDVLPGAGSTLSVRFGPWLPIACLTVLGGVALGEARRRERTAP